MLSRENFIEQLTIKNTKLISFDMDGVMTDGRITYLTGNNELRNFHAHDGYGIHMLQTAGFIVAVITSSKSEIMQMRCRVLGIKYCLIDVASKGDAIADICKKEGLTLDQALHMGDDVNDNQAFDMCGLSVAPDNALEYVKNRVDFVTRKKGGHGAVRELCELILISKTGKPFLDVAPKAAPLQ